jgi:hypothetical protein
MERQIRFTTKGTLLATAWIAVWLACATASIAGWYELGPWWFVRAASLFTIIVPPPAALGALCGRHAFGFSCGLVSFLALWLWVVVSPTPR